MIYQGEGITCSWLEDGIAEMCFDAKQGYVNKFDYVTLSDFGNVIEKLNNEKDLKGVIVTSSKAVFIVGADITEFVGMFSLPDDGLLAGILKSHELFSGFEDLPVPTVVALNGIAFGGGMEMALVCDLRIAGESASIGLPETKLGLIPGFGGTTRLPRIIGADNAIEMIAGGAPSKPAAALKVGAIDAVTSDENLKAVALKMLKSAIDGKIDWKAKRAQKMAPLKLNQIDSSMAFSTSKAFIYGKAGKNYPAPMVAVDVIEKSALLSRDEAIVIEANAFAKLAKTSASQSLIQLFLNDQILKKRAKIASKMASKIERASVLGAGIMGGGIAYQSVSKGIPVVMKDINTDALDLGMNEATKLFNKLVTRGKINALKMAQALSKISPTLHYTDVADTDIVIEAVVENPKIKDAVLQETEALLTDEAILCSNTSTISIDLLATNLKRPEKFCGMHFFNPVHKMPLVEVIRGSKSSDETIATVVAYASAIGKSPIVVNDCPGFFVNRVLFPYFGGFSMLLRDGADFVAVDKAMESFGWPMGPAYLLDVVGMDTGHHGNAVMAEGFPDRMSTDYKTANDVMYENKRYGQKTGSGFYKYEMDKKGRPKKLVDETTYELLAPITAERKDFDKQDIINRMMVPLVIETIRCIEDKIVDTVAEADMGLIYGLGFPPFRGGPLKYADSIGMDNLVKLADSYSHLGKMYEPTENMRKMAAAGDCFYPQEKNS